MELSVRVISDDGLSIVSYLNDVDGYSSEEDRKYAEDCGYLDVFDALLSSVEASEFVVGVFQGPTCLAVVGVNRNGAHYLDTCQVWAHPSAILRNKPKLLLPALDEVMALIDQQYPKEFMYAVYRSDDKDIQKLVDYAGFKLAYSDDIYGNKHRIAWRNQ